MTRDDAIARLRRQLPHLSEVGITGISLVGDPPQDGADPIEIVIDIDLDAHRSFDLLALVGIEQDLEGDLGVPVRAYMLWPGMLPARRAALMRDAVPITG